MIDDIDSRVMAAFATPGEAATPLYLIGRDSREADLAATPRAARAWAEATGFTAEAGAFQLTPDDAGGVGAALAGLGRSEPLERLGALPRLGGDRAYRLAGGDLDPRAAALAWAMGAYRFQRYRQASWTPARLAGTPAPAREWAAILATGVYLARDLVNTPAGDFGPRELEAAARQVAEVHGAAFETTIGEDLLRRGYPMIHAVGRAGPRPPRLLDMRWGDPSAPKLTLVGKGVCFDTGGLDVKPRASMRNMKKDMGGAAAALALAHMVMARELPVRLRVLIPAVENSIGSDAFRPGDILRSRLGLTVEIGDTDAEGRLVLADALAEADAEQPALLLDFATLTGAARVALGPSVAPFYTENDALAAELAEAGARVDDPIWRLPLWDGYESDLSSTVADMVNASSSGFAGSITAALFLRRFVSQAEAWAHFDIFAWTPKARPGRPEGGELQAARAVLEVLERRFGQGGRT